MIELNHLPSEGDNPLRSGMMSCPLPLQSLCFDGRGRDTHHYSREENGGQAHDDRDRFYRGLIIAPRILVLASGLGVSAVPPIL